MPSENGSERHEDLLKRLLDVNQRIEGLLRGLDHEDEIHWSGKGKLHELVSEQAVTLGKASSPIPAFCKEAAYADDFQKSKHSRTDHVESLHALVEEHAILNESLAEAGLSEDSQILPLVKNVWEDVRAVITLLESCRNHSLELMSLQERQKNCVAAYIEEANRQ